MFEVSNQVLEGPAPGVHGAWHHQTNPLNRIEREQLKRPYGSSLIGSTTMLSNEAETWCVLTPIAPERIGPFLSV